MPFWLLLGLVAGAVVLSVFWDDIKNWLSRISYKISSYSRLFIRKLSGGKQELKIEEETRIVDESEVPEEIRAKSSQFRDITSVAKQKGVLTY
jgi:hypothetical protein